MKYGKDYPPWIFAINSEHFTMEDYFSYVNKPCEKLNDEFSDIDGEYKQECDNNTMIETQIVKNKNDNTKDGIKNTYKNGKNNNNRNTKNKIKYGKLEKDDDSHDKDNDNDNDSVCNDAKSEDKTQKKENEIKKGDENKTITNTNMDDKCNQDTRRCELCNLGSKAYEKCGRLLPIPKFKSITYRNAEPLTLWIHSRCALFATQTKMSVSHKYGANTCVLDVTHTLNLAPQHKCHICG